MGRTLPLRRGPPTVLGNMNSYLQTDIVVGGQLLPVNIDTSSSWLWLATNETICLDPDGTQVNMTTCPFAQLYQDDSALSNATAAGPIYFGSSRSTTEYGTLTQGQVTIGGIGVQGLNVVLLNTTFPPDVGAGAGTLGLGPPVRACMYEATVPGGPDCTRGTTNVSQFHMTMEASGSWPFYSIALSRHTPKQYFGGLLGLGANLNVNDTLVNATGPTSSTNMSADLKIDVLNFTWTPVNTAVPTGVSTVDAPFTMNTMQHYNLVDESILPTMYGLYNPAPLPLLDGSGMSGVSCNATALPVSVSIGNGTFVMDACDMIFRNGTECFPAFQNGTTSTGTNPTLGQPFFNNVLGTWLFGAGQPLRFNVQARQFYAGLG